MTPDAVIDAYVADVAKRLPRAKRNDVALELKALLGEELQGRAADTGRAADVDMALELARGFGAPEDVAERYRAPGFTIVPATRSAKFAAIALGGVLLQWAITLPVALSESPEPLVGLGGWWLAQGIGALWWPGFMICIAIIGAWMRHRWPPAQTTWRPSAANSDEINRTAWVFIGLAAALGVASVVGAPWAIQTFLPAAASSFVFDPDFLTLGGAMVVFMWTLSAVLSGIVFVEGRWRPLTRRFDLISDALWIAVLAWLSFGPRIFVADISNEAAKGWISLVLLMVVIGVGVKLYRLAQRPQTTAALAAIGKN